ncbi:hypothetical protein [Nitrospirillum amazonense]|uniref:hypothetical protein n=1 Tax=Nitrospirillum amazonense TaxID=28077 RepID=UPI00241257F8|nr:hypothetical protein [Nitrospirillum amazonense]MDG3444626.1 hypothetical protein [Nitrospirillum amazonense]
MADYRKTPNARPWPHQLSEGDILTFDQAAPLKTDMARLRDFGLTTMELRRYVRIVTVEWYENWMNAELLRMDRDAAAKAAA